MNLSNILYAAVALVFVLALFWVFALVARRLGFGYPMPGRGMKRERHLSMVETMQLGTKHRLVLFRRDGVEHLVLLGPSSELLIENSIPAAAEFSNSTDTGKVPYLPSTKEQKEQKERT